MTPAMKKAERWLEENGGSGILDRYGRMVAGGETASQFDSSTWLRLVAAGRIVGCDGRLYGCARQVEEWRRQREVAS